MKNPLQALLWSANATSSTAFSTGNEPNAVSEREQSELRLPHPSRLSAFFTTFPGLVCTFERNLTENAGSD